MRINWVFLVCVCAFVCLLGFHSCAVAKPSKKLEATLQMSLPELECSISDLSSVVKQVLRSAHDKGMKDDVFIGIEYEHKDSLPKLKDRKIPAGTLREQIDKAAVEAGYVWQANGDWINLIPKAKEKDPKDIMNQRLPGKVVLSREKGKTTSINEWLAARNTVIVRRVSGGTLYLPGKPPSGSDETAAAITSIELDNPTLREFYNAHHTLYGNDEWAVWFDQIPPEKGGGVARTLLIEWSHSSKPVYTGTQDSKQQ